MRKSIGINAVLNMVKTISTIVFPLITFPYISRVLHVENVGIYNFCNSIVNYFILLAGLGISTYSVREGAQYRNDNKAMSNFASEVFSINMIATVFAYIVMTICLLLSSTLKSHMDIILILSVAIFFKTIGCDWLFTIYEEFRYITIRSIIFQFLSMVLLLVLVKNQDDLQKYALITVIASSGANVMNFFAKQKICKVKFVINRNMCSRLIPILILFANSIATTIYVNSDTTMVGFFCGDYYTGLYSVASKIYLIIKEVLASIIIVSVPRLATLLGEDNKEGFRILANKIFSALMILAIPSMIGLIMLSKNVVLIISGKEYVTASSALILLALALLCCIISWFFTSCILIPYKQEKNVLKATILAASINLILNIILIPIWKHNGAAFTTLIAEGVSMLVCYVYGKRFFKPSINVRDGISVVSGCIGIIASCYLILKVVDSVLISTITSILLSVLIYAFILLLFKNSLVRLLINKIKDRLKK